MYKNSFVHYLTKIVVDIMFFGGIVICPLMPYFTSWWARYSAYNKDLIQMNIIFFLSGVSAVYILWQLKRLFKTLLGGNPFVPGNVNCFRKMAVASLLIAILFVYRSILFFTFLSVTIIVVFVLATLFCLTLKDVFKQAVYYKEENDGVI